MANKTLLERLQTDAKRHRAPQTDVLPAWVKSGGKSVVSPAPVVIPQPEIEKVSEKSEKVKKADKKAKKKKK